MLLNFYIFCNEFQQMYQNCQKKENHQHIKVDYFSYESPSVYFYNIMWSVTKKNKMDSPF